MAKVIKTNINQMELAQAISDKVGISASVNIGGQIFIDKHGIIVVMNTDNEAKLVEEINDVLKAKGNGWAEWIN